MTINNKTLEIMKEFRCKGVVQNMQKNIKKTSLGSSGFEDVIDMFLKIFYF